MKIQALNGDSGNCTLPGRRPALRLLALGVTSMIVPTTTCAQPSAANIGTEPPAPSRALMPRFSTAQPGTVLPAGWREQTLRNIKPNQVDVVSDAGTPVLRFASDSAGSSVVHTLDPALQPAKRAQLRWRWRTSGFPRGAQLGDKSNDDFAARVYVIFDYPIEKVPSGQRWLLRMARGIYGEDIPLAVICYVWDRQAAVETLVDSPYSSRVKMLVARSGDLPGRWFNEQRDVERDFQRAFGAEHGPGLPPVKAIALAADTDQTGSALETWFGDVSIVN